MKNRIIIGLGEVGSALAQLEDDNAKKNHVNVLKHDPQKGLYVPKKLGNVSVLHICIPYSNNFVKTVVGYINDYQPSLTIIHSTVKMGTTRKIIDKVNKPNLMIVHSFVRGIHPQLVEGLVTFEKVIGSDIYEASVAGHDILRSIGIKNIVIYSISESELAKLLCTTYYGWNILFAKEVNKLCKKYDLDYYNVYTRTNQTYNKGYIALGKPNVVRPILQPPVGRVGGHCIVPNFHLLPNSWLKFASVFLEKIK